MQSKSLRKRIQYEFTWDVWLSSLLFLWGYGACREERKEGFQGDRKWVQQKQWKGSASSCIQLFITEIQNAAVTVILPLALAFLPSAMSFQVINGKEQGAVEKIDNVTKLEDEEMINVLISLNLLKKIAVSCLSVAFLFLLLNLDFFLLLLPTLTYTHMHTHTHARMCTHTHMHTICLRSYFPSCIALSSLISRLFHLY